VVEGVRIVKRLALGCLAVGATAALLAGGLALYVREKLDDIDTVDIQRELGGERASPSEPMTVLVVGTDDRPDLGGIRADAVIVLRLEPAADRAALLSIPRDSWVPIAGTGRDQRINTAIAGGAGAMVTTVQDLLGVPLDHYVQVDFDGFERLVDVVGGVDVAFPSPARDRRSGLDVVEAGCAHLDGRAALALVRSRRYEQLVDGVWRVDGTGDLGRIDRQQAFVAAVLGDVASTRDPRRLNRLLDVAADTLTVDDGLSGRDLLALGRDLRAIANDDVAMLTVPARPATIDGADVLELDPAGLAAAVDRLLGRTPTVTGATTVVPAPAPAPSLLAC
jgi:LCP family protein required for cell wall assembly